MRAFPKELLMTIYIEIVPEKRATHSITFINKRGKRQTRHYQCSLFTALTVFDMSPILADMFMSYYPTLRIIRVSTHF